VTFLHPTHNFLVKIILSGACGSTGSVTVACVMLIVSGVNASSRLGYEPPNGVGCGRGGRVLQPNEIGLRLSERSATDIGLLYPKVRNNIGGDIPVDVPPTKILGDVSPASPAGLTPVLVVGVWRKRIPVSPIVFTLIYGESPMMPTSRCVACEQDKCYTLSS